MKKYDILNSIKPVVEKSQYVKINEEAITSILPLLQKPDKEFNFIEDNTYLKALDDEHKIRFMLVCQAIDFCFWGDIYWGINYQGKDITGFWALITALIRAIEEGHNILDFNYLKDLSMEEFKNILRGNTTIPLIEERYQIIKEVANTVINKLNNNVYNLFIKANSMDELLELIVDTFESFRDISYYSDKEVYFFKRATLLANDLYNNIKEIRDGVKSNDTLLACADYKIPQVLRNNNVLEYSYELKEIIDNNIEIPQDSMMEIEIRANTIYAIELIKEGLNKKGIQMNSITVDTAIWLLSKTKVQQSYPFHLTRTIYY